MSESNILFFIGIVLILSAQIMFAYYIYTEKVNECTSDPLKFGVEKIRNLYDAEFISGSMHVVIDGKSRDWFFGDSYDFNVVE